MEEPSNETLATVFARLRSYCVDLLDLLRNPNPNPKRKASSLSEMAAFIRRAPASGLQACLDYTLFPLLLLLDASVQCRSGEKNDSGGGLGFGGSPVSDSVAEGVLVCLEEILKKCYLGSVNQMVAVMKKLTSGALLSPSEAAEEFREGIIRCFRAMLLMLQPCSVSSCSCKQISVSHAAMSITTLQTRHTIKNLPESQECLLAFLQSQDASAAVGHWLSLLLNTAEIEASRGHSGSSNLRKEAFLTLRVLVAKVGTADALAFFLPGTVSRFTKALYVSKNMISGAAGSSGSTEHAIRGLTEFLIIVLNDEANLHGLNLSIDDITGSSQNRSQSIQSVLEALRHLPANAQTSAENAFHQSLVISTGIKKKSPVNLCGTRSLYVYRSREWIDETAAHVDKLLSATFPHLSVHPAEKVRKALVDGIRGILTSCSRTLKRSKLMLVECLCILICDDSETVSGVAQESLEFLFMLGDNFFKDNEVSEIFNSLVEKLPRVILGSEETVAISHARKLLALLYYAGPDLVVAHVLCSPLKSARFLELLGLTMSQTLQYAGSINKLILSKPLSIGYLLSVAELKAGTLPSDASHLICGSVPSVNSRITVFGNTVTQNPMEDIHNGFEFPRMPPWFVHVGSQKLYAALAGILRLSGLSTMAGNKTEASLSILVDFLLDYFHKLISELRMREYNREGWQAWYSRSGSGQLLRHTSLAACMLNEIIYGLSEQSVSLYSKLFWKKGSKVVEARRKESVIDDDKSNRFGYNASAWIIRQEKDARDRVIHCVGSILHEYLSSELWALPVDQTSPVLEFDDGADLSLHFLRDTTMLHQVILEGIGIFSIVLGPDFTCSGFMHSSLYLLLQNLICSNSQIKNASDAVLRVLASSSGHATVGHLIVANADYIVDSLCRELRHLDLNPHVADVLAAMLSYIGAAHEILPLLEEPMRAISLELEVLGRHQHPHLTIPFLKAVCEIMKASRYEACKLPNEAESFCTQIKSKVTCLQNIYKEKHAQNIVPNVGPKTSEMECVDPNDVKLQLEHWEGMLFQLNEMRRYRRIIGSLVGSCLKTATPLLSSMKDSTCLLALNIVEDATISLAKVEEAYKYEKETTSKIERAIQLCSCNDLEDTLDATDEADENRLLPAINKIWPFLVLCLKNKISVAVVSRCTSVVSKVVQTGGGDFFTRRFLHDGPALWKLLTVSPFRRKPGSSKDERLLLLPYRTPSVTPDEPISEVSSLKIQVAVLNMVAELSSNKRSSPALEVVFKKISGLVVGIACSSMVGLRDASMRALLGLSCIDPDLIWLLLADVYFSLKKKDFPLPPDESLYGISQLLPPSASSKEYLYLQYGGESFGFDVDPLSVETVFQKVQSVV